MRTMRASQRFIGVSAALFFGSAALTVAWCPSMSAMHDMPLCTLSTTWMRGAPAFLVMWLTMMVAMMLPSLMPMLLRYRQTVTATSAMRLDALTAWVGLAYFFVWTVFGAVAFAASSVLTDLDMRWPPATGLLVLTAGVLQFTRWKAHYLACCRGAPDCCSVFPAETSAACRHGLRLGMHCVHCCFGLTVMLLALGMMDLRAMALVTAAISIERLAPDGLRAARLVGVVLVAMGAFLIANVMV